MNVAQLIAALSELDPDLPVVMIGLHEDFCEVEEALEDLVCPAIDGGLELCDERDVGVRRAARLIGGSDDRRPFLKPHE